MLESCRRCWSTQLHPATVTTRCTAQLLGRRPAPAPARQSAGGRPPSPATVPGISALLSIPIRPGLISMSVVTAPRRTLPDRAAVARRPAGRGWAGPGWRGAGTRDCFWDCRVPAAGGWAGTAHLRTTSPSDPRPLARAISPKLAPDENVTDIILSSSYFESLSYYSI